MYCILTESIIHVSEKKKQHLFNILVKKNIYSLLDGT